VHPVVRRILAHRGIADPAAVRAFLECSPGYDNPFGMADMDRAVSRIRSAVRAGDRIAVYGDYDADGVTATALLGQVLGSIGAVARPFLPHREREGYGLHAGALDRLADEGVRLVITVDCGIRDATAVAGAAARGMDVIVTDHHVLPAELPRAFAVVNPHRPDCRYGFTGLSGVGLAYKLAQALLTVEERVPALPRRAAEALDVRSILDLVAIGTVADVVPLTGENRSLVKRGLDALRASQRPGLRALLAAAEVPAARVTARTLGWTLGPRLNAAGRMDDADSALLLLTTSDEAEAAALAQELEERNTLRRALTEEAVAAALGAVGDPAPPFVVHVSSEAPVGVLGLVASRLAERFYRPAAAIRVENGVARGSLRSIPELHVAEALEACADVLERYGGHALAAGFTADSRHLGQITERLVAHAAERLAGGDLRRELAVDAAVSPQEVDWALYEALEALEPFGEGNQRPLLCVRGAAIRDGKVVGSDHLRFQMRAGRGNATIRAIAFGHGDRLAELPEAADVVGTLRRGEWAGQMYLEFKVADFQPAEPAES
jgi:single-stranded-DNA-specific exonuclease